MWLSRPVNDNSLVETFGWEPVRRPRNLQVCKFWSHSFSKVETYIPTILHYDCHIFCLLGFSPSLFRCTAMHVFILHNAMKKYILQIRKNLWSWICCNIFYWGFVIPDKHRIFGEIHQVRIGWKPSRQPFRPQGPPFPGKRKEKHFLLFLYFFNSFTLSVF
jgi:hypothetical protein